MSSGTSRASIGAQRDGEARVPAHGRTRTYTSRPAAIAEFTAPPSKMQPGDCDGKCWCEHVALLECVREARGAAQVGREEGGLRVGVLPSLVAERKWGVAFKHRQARWAAMQAAATHMAAILGWPDATLGLSP